MPKGTIFNSLTIIIIWEKKKTITNTTFPINLLNYNWCRVNPLHIIKLISTHNILLSLTFKKSRFNILLVVRFPRIAHTKNLFRFITSS